MNIKYPTYQNNDDKLFIIYFSKISYHVYCHLAKLELNTPLVHGKRKTVVLSYKLTACSVGWWLVADGWCWFLLREEHCWLVAGGWFVLREKYCWLVADKPSEQAVKLNSIVSELN
jgi:hypothetical protein